MPLIEASADETAMLAAGLDVGDFAFRVDLKQFFRCLALPSNVIGSFALAGTPQGCSIYQDAVTSEWMAARRGEAYTPFAISAVPPAGGGGPNIGTATIDFGAYPGKSDASVVVTGQGGIATGSVVIATIRPSATADHSADEHIHESIAVVAGDIVAGTGFTIYARNVSQINEPVQPTTLARFSGTGQWPGPGQQDHAVNNSGGKGTRIYGQYSVQWMWS